MKNIGIVGGGTAGWLTALFIRKKFPSSNITLIESSEIGILGAGEGTTPHFLDFLMEVDIPLRDIIKFAGGTIKNGIMFTNWNGDGSRYFHPFHDNGTRVFNALYVGDRISKGKNLNDLVPSYSLSCLNKVKFKLNRDKKIEEGGSVALHFDARLLANYLKNKGIERGINLVDSKVKQLHNNSNNDITGLELEDGKIIDVDFVFDCSGFKRLIIGNHFKSEWKSYSKSIPNKKAMPFFIPNEGKDLPPYTEAIAMKYGWVWKIPVQGRFGCGYVFDSAAVAESEIRKEIHEVFGEVETPRVFEFEPGCFKELWKNNCIALGLSSGFIEPLEATSIWVTILSLRNFLRDVTGATENNKFARNNFNRVMFSLNEQILAFIYFHYITRRKDTEYWSNFNLNNEEPSYYKEIKDLKDYIDFDYLNHVLLDSFPLASILTVGAGGGFFSESAGKDLLKRYSFLKRPASSLEDLNEDYLSFEAFKNFHELDSLEHLDFIKRVKNDQ